MEAGMTPLRDPLVFVTGASSGIGRACAEAFAREGARLLLAARRIERLEALAADLERAHGTRSHLLRLDVRRAADVATAVERLPEAWRDVDILINNAGLARGLAPI